MLDKRKEIKRKYEKDDLVRTADIKKVFSKSYTTNWSHKLYKITEIIKNKIPAYKINNLPGRYNELLLKKDRVNTERK